MAAPDPRVTAAVLVGGQSRRMGTDKARLELDGVALATRVAEVASLVASQVLLCGSRDDLSDLGHRVVADLHPGAGPLAGLQAALRAASTPWVLLLACDLPGVDRALLEGLIARLEGVERDTEAEAKEGRVDAVVVRSVRGPEPLVALYHRRVAGEVGARLDRGERAVHRLLSCLRVLWHEVEDTASLENLNTPEDLAHFRAPGDPPTR